MAQSNSPEEYIVISVPNKSLNNIVNTQYKSQLALGCLLSWPCPWCRWYTWEQCSGRTDLGDGFMGPLMNLQQTKAVYVQETRMWAAGSHVMAGTTGIRRDLQCPVSKPSSLDL